MTRETGEERFRDEEDGDDKDAGAQGQGFYNWIQRPQMVSYVTRYVKDEVPQIVRKNVKKAVDHVSSRISPRVLGYTHKMSKHLDDIAYHVGSAGDCYITDPADFDSKEDELMSIFSTERDIKAINNIRKNAPTVYQVMQDFARRFPDMRTSDQNDVLKKFFKVLGVAEEGKEGDHGPDHPDYAERMEKAKKKEKEDGDD